MTNTDDSLAALAAPNGIRPQLAEKVTVRPLLFRCISGVGKNMALRKPARRRTIKRKQVLVIRGRDAAAIIERLDDAATAARYVSSPYHRARGSPMGNPRSRSWPHASKCNPYWRQTDATRALKDAIRAGQVSAEWDGQFPKYVWHQDAEILYEARLSNRDQGEYHAYPLEDKREWPRKFLVSDLTFL